MGFKLVTAPANDPVTLVEAKAHLREVSSDFDTTISAFISAATDFVDGPQGYLGRALIDQTWDYYLDQFPCVGHEYGRRWDTNYRWLHQAYIEIPLPPLIEVIGVYYLDANGDEQQVDASSYRVDPASDPGRIIPLNGVTWPIAQCTPSAVRIRFRAGYVDTGNSPYTDDVPPAIKAAILLYMADLYANRENTIVGATAAELPFASRMLLKKYRSYLSMA